MRDQTGAIMARHLQGRGIDVPVFSRLAGWATAMAVAIFFPAALSVASAAEKKGPIAAEIVVEIEHDWTTDSDDRDAELHDTFATVEVGLAAGLAKGLALKSLLVFEPVQDPGPREDRFFKDHGLYAEELLGEFETGPFAFRAGKFGQKFGIA